MARIRSIHPGWFTDEAWVSVSAFARLLGIGIWTQCDDQGVFEWKPIALKMRLFPVDNVDLPGMLAELANADLIKQFTVGGREYGAVRNFTRYQRPKKPKCTFPITMELRTYCGSSGPSSEPDDDEDDGVLRKAETAAQMEEGGGSIPSDRGRPPRLNGKVHSSVPPARWDERDPFGETPP